MHSDRGPVSTLVDTPRSRQRPLARSLIRISPGAIVPMSSRSGLMAIRHLHGAEKLRVHLMDRVQLPVGLVATSPFRFWGEQIARASTDVTGRAPAARAPSGCSAADAAPTSDASHGPHRRNRFSSATSDSVLTPEAAARPETLRSDKPQPHRPEPAAATATRAG